MDTGEASRAPGLLRVPSPHVNQATPVAAELYAPTTGDGVELDVSAKRRGKSVPKGKGFPLYYPFWERDSRA